MSTFVYNPGVKVYIDTHDYGILDVSDDLTNGNMQRRSDGVSQFQFGLNNVRRKYDNVFKPNDRIVVVMKRLTWLRTYTGYLNSVPLISSWPRQVQVTSSCSIKRLQYFYWDPNLQSSQNLVRQSLLIQNDGTAPDGGIKQVVINLLEEVVDWSGSQALNDKKLAGSKVHIGAIPANWFDYAAVVARSVADNQKEEAALAEALLAHLGAGASIGGQSAAANGVVSAETYSGYTLNAKKAEYASRVISTAYAEGATAREAAQCIACCLVESELIMYASDKYKESTNYPHEKVGRDYDSLGLFQQRPSQGWGTVAQCMNVEYSTKKFFGVLKGIKGRESLPFGDGIYLVQNCRVDLKGRYGTREAQATAIVAAYTANPNGTLGSALGSTNNSASGNNSATSPLGNGTATGAHLVATARALTTSRQVPYSQENTSRYDDPEPKILDCSSFTQWVYYHALGTIGTPPMPRHSGDIYTWAIQNGGLDVTVESAFNNPGCLVFVGSTPAKIHHMEMTVSPGRTIGAHQTGTTAGEINYSPKSFNLACTLPGVAYPAGATVPTASGTTPGAATSASAVALATGASGQRTDIVQGANASAIDNLFGPTPWINASASGDTGLAQSLIGIRSLQNDEPILPYLTNLLNSTMRQFCSAPNGDFIAWFPDYYGLWGTAAKMVLQPIEVKDFTIDWSDEFIVTHQFVVPTNYGGQQLDLSTGDVAAASVLSQIVSAGIATIEQPGIMAALFGLDQTETEIKRFTKDVLERFGARPDMVQVPGVTGPKGEFFMALFLFMQSWTHQFTANIGITYMPELYPGMLVQFPEYNFQAYVVQVEHAFTLGEGGGFSTTINIAAPSRLNDTGGEDKLLGLPIAGTKFGKGGPPAKGGTAAGRTTAPPKAKVVTDGGTTYVQGRGGRQAL